MQKSRFHHFFLQQNEFDRFGFDEWVFYPGMLFNDSQKWWAGRDVVRRSPHEGIDFCFYRDSTGLICNLDEKTKIPVLFEGKVVRIHNDFLGKSVYVQHNVHGKQEQSLFTIYGHMTPLSGLAQGDFLQEGDILATVANTRECTKILPHAHITVAWISESFPHEKLNWEAISNPHLATLCNPLEFIDCKFTVEKKKSKRRVFIR
ncbi:MAG: M23 family metallopeptidase [Candidatus Kuenenia sp.]|nr:M23 family metallopeptidase [Candidatus Kuenenia hertensis]